MTPKTRMHRGGGEWGGGGGGGGGLLGGGGGGASTPISVYTGNYTQGGCII